MESQKGDTLAFGESKLQGKISGYASGGQGQEKISDNGSQGYVSIEQGYRYLDRN
jgi:hypothetical protein